MIRTFILYLNFASFVPLKFIFLYVITCILANGKLMFSPYGLITAVHFLILNCLLVMINSYFDMDVDEVSHQNRPLASNTLTKLKAKDFILFTLIPYGLLLILLPSMIISFTSLIMLLVYYLLLKTKYASDKKWYFIIAYSLLAPIYSGAFTYLTGYSFNLQNSLILIVYAFYLFLIDIGHDSYQDFLDKPGDRQFGIKKLIDLASDKTVFSIIIILDCLSFILLYLLFMHQRSFDFLSVLFFSIAILIQSGVVLVNIFNIRSNNSQNNTKGKFWHNWPVYSISALIIPLFLKFWLLHAVILFIVIPITFIDARRRAYKDVYFIELK